ncbi:YfhO family protein, partial [bacterium]|nr:YfhO family protein [bacterium]
DRYADIRKENSRDVQFLKSDDELFRLFPVPSFKILDQAGYHLHGIPVITGFHDLTIGRYDRILQELEPVVQMLSAKYLQGAEVPYSDGEMLTAIQPLVNLLNGKYLVVPKPLELKLAQFPLRFESERFRLYENPRALPWFYLAPAAEVHKDGPAVLERLGSGQVDPQRVVLLEREPSIALGVSGDAGGDRIERLEYDLPAGVIRLRTHSAGPRVLVVSENYHTNWSVTVDGQAAQMLRANYVWKGVVVPAGTHEVEFRYFSRSLAWSRAATFLSLLLVTGIAIRQLRRRSAAAA